ncbi:hypothetical protein M8C21_007024, partial [Ambrosia artemisiifolia]
MNSVYFLLLINIVCHYTQNVLSSSLGWVVALIQLPPKFEYLQLRFYAGFFLCHLNVFLLFALYTCSHPLPHTSPLPCLLPPHKNLLPEFLHLLPFLSISLSHFFQVILQYHWMSTDFLDATIFDRAATQLLGMPCKEMFANPDPRTLIYDITAKPIQFTIRAVKDDRIALTTYSVNSVVRLQPEQNADTTSSSNIQGSATPTPLTPAPANPSVTEKKGTQLHGANCLMMKPKGQPLTSRPAAAKSERHQLTFATSVLPTPTAFLCTASA